MRTFDDFGLRFLTEEFQVIFFLLTSAKLRKVLEDDQGRWRFSKLRERNTISPLLLSFGRGGIIYFFLWVSDELHFDFVAEKLVEFSVSSTSNSRGVVFWFADCFFYQRSFLSLPCLASSGRVFIFRLSIRKSHSMTIALLSHEPRWLITTYAIAVSHYLEDDREQIWCLMLPGIESCFKPTSSEWTGARVLFSTTQRPSTWKRRKQLWCLI